MDVTVTGATPKPLTLCALAAGCCYGKETVSERRLETCLNAKHLSVFEHASATWRIADISRACSHQLVRHRLASYSQQSQRYCRIDVNSDDWYVVPPDIRPTQQKDPASDAMETDDRLMSYTASMDYAAAKYMELLNLGVKPEDARYVLPNACKTDIHITMNFREFMHFLDVRLDKSAQWEIRELAEKMARALWDWGGEWRTLLCLYEDRSGRMFLKSMF